MVNPQANQIDLSSMDPVTVSWQWTSSKHMTGVITIKKAAIEDTMILEWIKDKLLYEQWERECRPATVHKPKKPAGQSKKPVKLEIPTEVKERLEKTFGTESQRPRGARANLKLKSCYKIEDGMIKYEYTNKYNLRVNNFRTKDPKNGKKSQLDRVLEAMSEDRPSNPIKSEVKTEGVKAEDCFIEKIDYTKKVPDFRLVPQNVIVEELKNNGIRTMVKKAEIIQLILVVWQYRKGGEIPFKYYFEEDEPQPQPMVADNQMFNLPMSQYMAAR